MTCLTRPWECSCIPIAQSMTYLTHDAFLFLCRQVQTCPSKILGYNGERLSFIQLLVRNLCLCVVLT